MFASMQKPQAAAKRPAEDEKEEATGWRSATALALSQDSRFGQWKRLKTDESEASATSSTQSQKPMLGAWFGARSSQLGMTQANSFARTKQEEQEDSEDDKPLAKVVSREVKPAQRQTQKQAARTQSKQASANATQARSGITSARNVAANAERVSSNEDERVFQLSSKRRVTVRKWKSAVLVDIREYYDDNGVSKPGKKGISLAKDQWSTLLRLSRVIDKAIALVEEDSVDPHSLENVKERGAVSSEERSIAFTLSSKRRITVRFFRTAVLVDIREYYEQGSEMKPGKKGISLSKDQWRGLHKIEPEISEAIQEL
ncbi:hypothetical protein Poli38472_003920 [Pythium oligandrum]|uniref:Transcriptional coactivator p15 (PC4) C-terminal domain-containing protein n=1 Tax=Pythium oligandrum TaxID=41045 RepID=A0A8K1CP35_PYTOL|nr:hypothetical protein Poli38472_003920 [Pythium oligandrum]|eukprot:TMW66155.1 hypothetical protein Poli38472_003920 [Pythium oligandrum]